eukprot:6064998-Amphidinium_carterae.1
MAPVGSTQLAHLMPEGSRPPQELSLTKDNQKLIFKTLWGGVKTLAPLTFRDPTQPWSGARTSLMIRGQSIILYELHLMRMRRSFGRYTTIVKVVRKYRVLRKVSTQS